jgi:hypothetical protein
MSRKAIERGFYDVEEPASTMCISLLLHGVEGGLYGAYQTASIASLTEGNGFIARRALITNH